MPARWQDRQVRCFLRIIIDHHLAGEHYRLRLWRQSLPGRCAGKLVNIKPEMDGSKVWGVAAVYLPISYMRSDNPNMVIVIIMARM